jgi:hypothetical protein
MPITKKGIKILSGMKKEYGAVKGKEVYFASIVKGKIKGVEGKDKKGTLLKAEKTYEMKHKKSM